MICLGLERERELVFAFAFGDFDEFYILHIPSLLDPGGELSILRGRNQAM